ncbi:hypothetical protein WMY93_000606 [Mugilogobius chulae]|uniref:Uncharacterized protein n=1 Tax=Mugilogobius chulae TaxID=88201 RepID=A0AAW0Q1D4_9GOBI
MRPETLSSSQLSVKTAALRMVDLPLSVYGSLTQVTVSPGTKRLVAATALGAVSLLYLARRFQRRKSKKRRPSPPATEWDQAKFEAFAKATAQQQQQRHDHEPTDELDLALPLHNGSSTGLVITQKLTGNCLDPCRVWLLLKV